MRRGILWVVVPVIRGGGVGGPSVPHHIQCGGGRSGPTLGSGGGRESGRSGRVRRAGTTLKRPILGVSWDFSVIRPGMDAGGF